MVDKFYDRSKKLGDKFGGPKDERLLSICFKRTPIL